MKKAVLIPLIFFIFLSFIAHPAKSAEETMIGGRAYELYVPANLPPKGHRAMVVVLHGGMGSSSHIRQNLGLDETAKKFGFIVAYLNGSRASPKLPKKMHAWNGGGECCGLPLRMNIDDVGYISMASTKLAQDYGVDSKKIFVTGHSNGAIMSARLMCETDIFKSAVLISGALNIDAKTCPKASGKQILAIHGQDDQNYPVAGGIGEKGVANINFKPQSYSKDIFEKSGATYTLEILANTPHKLDAIRQNIHENQKMTLGDKIATFFKLNPSEAR